MSDPFIQHADAICHALLGMETHAPEADLFALGCMVPQAGLEMEMADYEPSEVDAADFGATYWRWLEMAFEQDGMSTADRTHIQKLWSDARAAA